MWIGFYFTTQGIKQNSISAFLKNIQKLIQEVLTNICSVVYNKKISKESDNWISFFTDLGWRLSAGQRLRYAKRKYRRFWTALNCRQRKSVKDSFDFEFQSRLHECEATTAKGIGLSFCGKSVRICVPAFFVARKPATTEWPAGWDMILPRPLVWTERAKRRCGETPGQE